MYSPIGRLWSLRKILRRDEITVLTCFTAVKAAIVMLIALTAVAVVSFALPVLIAWEGVAMIVAVVRLWRSGQIQVAVSTRFRRFDHAVNRVFDTVMSFCKRRQPCG